MRLRAQAGGPLRGRLRPPGDKSLSHRALMLAALAVGESRVSGLVAGEDVLATAGALRQLGAEITPEADGAWTVHGVGVGGLAEPEDVLDLGNAGTGARLLLGLLAGHDFTAFVTGDASLRRRPMERVMAPLRLMGAEFRSRRGGRLPLAVTGAADPIPIVYETPVASAQIKSAVLLAGLHAPGRTTVIEPAASRDHTERMLRLFGAGVETGTTADGRPWARVAGQPELRPVRLELPADPSSAAFPLVAALLTPGSAIELSEVGVNPLRTGLLETLIEMGAELEVVAEGERAGEPVATVRARHGGLAGIEVPPERVPRMIDEYPVLMVAAACARGTTVMRGLGELRVKESDRVAVMADGLRACGVEIAVDGDGVTVHGTGVPPAGGALVDARHDHRIAMSFLVLGGVAAAPVAVDGAETIATSFPEFAAAMNGLGMRIGEVA